MNIVSIDIGSYSLKAIHARKKKDGLEIIRVVEAPNMLGVSIPSDEITREKFIQQLQSFFSDNQLPLSEVRLSLPESIVSTKIIQVPVLSDAELASAIGWQAEQHIPIPKDDLSLEYQVVYRPPKNEKDVPMRVLLVGAKRSVIEQFVECFIAIGIEPSCLETQTISILRTLRPAITDPVTLVAHMGFSTLDIHIVRQAELSFVFSHPNGGVLLTRAIENMLQLAANQAEEYKRTYGLNPQFFEGKVQMALQPAVKAFIDYMTKAMQYYSTQYPGERVERVIFSGGSAQLPDFVPYAAAQLGVEVLLIEPFAQLVGEIPQANHTAFSVCVGLLLRNG